MKRIMNVFVMLVFSTLLLVSAAFADSDEITFDVVYDKTEIEVGDTITASFSVMGGSGKYKTLVVAWYLYADGGTSSSAIVTKSFSGKTSGKISCSPNASGEVRLFITVTDSVGRSSHKTFPSVSVSGDSSVEPLTIEATCSTDRAMIGDSISATFEVSGGSGKYPTCVAAWYLYADGGNNPTAIVTKSFSGKGTIICKPETSGIVRLFVTVTDSEGRSSHKTFFEIPVSQVYSQATAEEVTMQTIDWNMITGEDLLDQTALSQVFATYLVNVLGYSETDAERMLRSDFVNPHTASFVVHVDEGEMQVAGDYYEVRVCRTDFSESNVLLPANCPPFVFYILYDKDTLMGNATADYCSADAVYVIPDDAEWMHYQRTESIVVRINADSVYLRDTNGAVLALMPKGATLEIMNYDRSCDMFSAVYGDKSGYVKGAGLSIPREELKDMFD